MQETQGNRLDETTQRYAGKYDAFAKTTTGNAILEFINFKRNLMPYTLQILFVAGVIVLWIFGIATLFGKGPIGASFTEIVEKTVNGREVAVPETDYLSCIILGLVFIVAGPFVLHYFFEAVKYVFLKIFVPLWEKLIIRFLVNVLPELAPFLLERIMRAIDITLTGIVAIIMTIAAVLKGVVWLPKVLCQRLDKWCKTADK